MQGGLIAPICPMSHDAIIDGTQCGVCHCKQINRLLINCRLFAYWYWLRDCCELLHVARLGQTSRLITDGQSIRIYFSSSIDFSQCGGCVNGHAVSLSRATMIAGLVVWHVMYSFKSVKSQFIIHKTTRCSEQNHHSRERELWRIAG